MARYLWTGHAPAGRTRGELDAPSAGAVADLLHGRGITPLTIRPADGASAAVAEAAVPAGELLRRGADQALAALQARLLRGTAVSGMDLMLFCRQLHTLLRSGVPILRALSGLQESTASPALATTLGEVKKSLESGLPLSTALARQGGIFDAYFVALVRVGETTGRLDEVFLRLFRHLEFEIAMRQQVKAALRYPSFVIAAMVVALAVINLMVIPAFAHVFEQAGAALPLPTRLLMASSRLTIDHGGLMLAGAVASWLAFRRWRATPQGRLRWEAWLLHMPVAGTLVRKAVLARFARSYALSLRSGVPVSEALSLVAQTVDNAHIALKVEGMRSAVERGESILRAASASGVFTPVVLQMIAVGEETGAIDELMDEVGELYGNEVEYELKTLGQQIEPLLIVMLGALVLLLALGVFLPVWNLGRTVMGHGA